jgi:hypothetical protein
VGAEHSPRQRIPAWQSLSSIRRGGNQLGSFPGTIPDAPLSSL